MVSMTQMIKVYKLDDKGLKFEEVDISEAERLLEEAHAQGNIVLNKKGGEAVTKGNPDIEELLIIKILFGG